MGRLSQNTALLLDGSDKEGRRMKFVLYEGVLRDVWLVMISSLWLWIWFQWFGQEVSLKAGTAFDMLRDKIDGPISDSVGEQW